MVLLLSAYLAFDYSKDKTGGQERFIEQDISPFVEALHKEASQLFQKILPVCFDSLHTENIYKLTRKKWYLIIFKNGEEYYWNSNKINIDTLLIAETDFPRYYHFGDDFYAVFRQDSAFLAFRISNDGILSKHLRREYPKLSGYHLFTDKKSRTLKIDSILQFVHSPSEGMKDWIVISFVFVLFLVLFFYYLKQKRILPAIVTALLLVFVNFGAYYFSSNSHLSVFTLYRPELYAGSSVLNSLGVLIQHLLTALPFLFLWHYAVKSYRIPAVGSVLLFCLLFFASDLVLGLTEGLVIDSNIPMNFEELNGISFFSFVAIILIGFLFLGLCFMVFASGISVALFAKKQWVRLTIAALIFILFQYYDASRSLLSLSYPLILVILFATLIQVIRNSKIRLISLYVFIALITTLVLLNSRKTREFNYIRLYASKLVANQDLRAEYVLKSIEDRLADEFLVPEDYQNFNQRKDIVENRIKRLYFSNYLEKYELRLISFDSIGININDNDLYSYEALNDAYNNHTQRTVSNYFLQINNPASFNGYIAKYENCDIYGDYGTTFILLQPRLIQSEFLYPEAFANQKKSDLINLGDYSYGIYYQGKLISQNGRYAYSLNRAPLPNKESIRNNGDYYHRVFDYRDQFKVIISKPVNIWKNWVTTFTFSFLALIPLALAGILFFYFYAGRNDPFVAELFDFKGRFMSTRIQFSLTLLLLAGLLFSVYIIINYIRSNYNSTLENNLLKTVKNIGTQFQNKVDLKQKLAVEEEIQLMLNEESSAFKVDLNLYDSEGRLLGTTKPYLISREIMSELMNPRAFRDMRRKHYSQLMIQEELEGSKYLSAYVPLFDAKNEVIAYLNTPYFARNEELNKQISSVIVNVINIYFLMLIGGLVIALIISKRISKPLLLIRQRIAETELGIRNELIVYHRDDEIGQLVKQYNKMVRELEKSANKLAETEREGAWREMAKQVAHEIKNPLTPMKLSIQHLQRAYEQKSENVDELFHKTCKLLIEQIESLSNMAGEFSSFAKMPDNLFVFFDLSESLQKSIDLFISAQEKYGNTEIKQEIEPGICIYADPEQMKRVIINLIKNAIQSIPENRTGQINVMLHREKQTAIIRVQDNGSGIPEEIRHRVFVPNFSTKNSGMGLGLAISRKIVERAGGTIHFETAINSGTTFEVRIPLKDEV